MIGYGTSGTDHDFFVFDVSSKVWNGSAFVTWSDADYADYRVAASEVGTTGRFFGTAPAGTETYELRERGASLAASYVVWTSDLAEKKLLEADQVISLDGGVYKLHLYERGTATDLVTSKTMKQPSGDDLTDPTVDYFGGYVEE